MEIIRETTNNTVSVIQNEKRKWGVIDNQGKTIVPFGKYDWIDGFDQGLARVNKWIVVDQVSFLKKKFWGIINESGEEVLPLEYDEVWNFFGKNRYSTKVVKNGVSRDVYFCDLNPDLPQRDRGHYYDDNDHDYNDDSYDDLYFDINKCYDYQGNFDYERLEDAIMDGEYVPEDW